MAKSVTLTHNCLLEDHEMSGRARVRRLLHIDAAGASVVLIDVQEARAMPERCHIRELEDAVLKGALVVREEDLWFADMRPDSDLSEAMRRQRDRRLEIILPLVDEAANPHQEILREECRHALVKGAHLATGAAVDNIYYWLRLWWKRGQVPNALLPAFPQCGARLDGEPRRIGVAKRGRPSILSRADATRAGMNVTEEVRRKLVLGGKRYWKKRVNGHPLTLREAFQRTLEDFFRKRIELRDGHLVPVVWESPTDDAHLPTFRQFCYWLGKERSFERDATARYGERTYWLKLRPVLGDSRHLSRGPSDLYLIDATVADVYLVSSRNRKRIVGRPVLYLVVDHFDRMIAGFYAGFEGPSWRGALMALENAFTRKRPFCLEHGIEIDEEDWPTHLIPRRLTADRGEFMNIPSDGLVPGFGLTLINTPPFRADFKSLVEGQFKLSNERGIRRVPGAVHKVRDRGDPDYRLDAQLDIYQFRRLMIELILFNNLRRRLDRAQIPDAFPLPEDLDVRPIDLWQWGIANRIGMGRETPRSQVRLNLLPSYQATTGNDGLSVLNGLLCYDSPTLSRLGHFSRGAAARHFDLRLDDRNVSVGYLRLDGGRHIEEVSLTKKFARYAGWSLDELQVEQESWTVAAQAQRGASHQDRAELNARVDAIVSDATSLGAVAAEPHRGKRARDIRTNRRDERQHLRKQEAFTGDPSRAGVSTSSDATSVGGRPRLVLESGSAAGDLGDSNGDEYVPFPS